jgi:hypothetical protein
MVPPFSSFIGVDRPGFSITDRLDQLGIDSELVNNVLFNGIGAAL